MPPRLRALFKAVINIPESAVTGKLTTKVELNMVPQVATELAKNKMNATTHTDVGIVANTTISLRSLIMSTIQMFLQRFGIEL